MKELFRLDLANAQVIAVEGDLTTMAVDVVVNAANERLAHGGGLAAAIARAAGPRLDEESRRWVAQLGPVTAGTAAITTAGNMPARWVVHTVGPRFGEGRDNAGTLAAAVRAALDAAIGLAAESMAIPAVSTGIFGYPAAEATGIIAATVLTRLASRPGPLRRVLLVGYDQATAELFAAALASSDPAVDQPPQ